MGDKQTFSKNAARSRFVFSEPLPPEVFPISVGKLRFTREQRVYILLRGTLPETRWHAVSKIATKCGILQHRVGDQISALRTQRFGGFDIRFKKLSRGPAYQLVATSVSAEKEQQLFEGRKDRPGPKRLDRESILNHLQLLEEGIAKGEMAGRIQKRRIGLLGALHRHGYIDQTYVPPLDEITPEERRNARLGLLDALITQGALAREDLEAWLKQRNGGPDEKVHGWAKFVSQNP